MLSESAVLVEWLQMHIIPIPCCFAYFKFALMKEWEVHESIYVDMKAKLEDKFLHVDYD